MIETFIKKSGILTSKIARDFYLQDVGSRILTVTEYTEKFSASRGLVYNAIQILVDNNCITLKKSGKLGTFIESKNIKQLLHYTGWDSFTGTMPIPLNDQLSSLASALCIELKALPSPFLFAYISGAKNRLNYLKNNLFDFIIVSKSTAEDYLSKYDFLEEVMILEDNIYSLKYKLFAKDAQNLTPRDGLRVAIDNKCTDQLNYSHQAFANYDVEFIPLPYTEIGNALLDNEVDVGIYRPESWIVHLPSKELEFINEENVFPSILTYKNNYNMKSLLEKVIDKDRLLDFQEKILKKDIPLQFY